MRHRTRRSITMGVDVVGAVQSVPIANTAFTQERKKENLKKRLEMKTIESSFAVFPPDRLSSACVAGSVGLNLIILFAFLPRPHASKMGKRYCEERGESLHHISNCIHSLPPFKFKVDSSDNFFLFFAVAESFEGDGRTGARRRIPQISPIPYKSGDKRPRSGCEERAFAAIGSFPWREVLQAESRQKTSSQTEH